MLMGIEEKRIALPVRAPKKRIRSDTASSGREKKLGKTLVARRRSSISSDIDVKRLLTEERPRFPLFRKLPPELRHIVWNMAAETGIEINLEQSCRCSPKSGQVQLNATEQLMDVVRQRLALVHTCHEARALLAPRYDAFPYTKLLAPRFGSGGRYDGVVEALDDLFLRPSASSRRRDILSTEESRSWEYQSKSLVMRTRKDEDEPELTWKHDHSYDPITGGWLDHDCRKPHVLLDVQQDTFSGRVDWRGDPWCANKRLVSLCALKRPGSPLSR